MLKDNGNEENVASDAQIKPLLDADAAAAGKPPGEASQEELNAGNVSSSKIMNTLLGKNDPNKKMAIKDVLGINFDIEGAEEIPVQEKYLFVEDKHAMGDLDSMASRNMLAWLTNMSSRSNETCEPCCQP